MHLVSMRCSRNCDWLEYGVRRCETSSLGDQLEGGRTPASQIADRSDTERT